MFPPMHLQSALITFCSVTIKLHHTVIMLEHEIRSKLNLCFWAMVTHVWLQNKLSPIPFEVGVCSCIDNNYGGEKQCPFLADFTS